MHLKNCLPQHRKSRLLHKKPLRRCRAAGALLDQGPTPRATTAKWAGFRPFGRPEAYRPTCGVPWGPACSICCIAAWEPTAVSIFFILFIVFLVFLRYIVYNWDKVVNGLCVIKFYLKTLLILSCFRFILLHCNGTKK